MRIRNFEVISYRIPDDSDCGSRDYGISYLCFDKGLTLDFHPYRIHFTWGEIR